MYTSLIFATPKFRYTCVVEMSECPKHFLYTLHIRSVLQHMRGKRMSQRMWCNIMLDSSFLRIALQNFPESLSAHGLAGTVGKKDSLSHSLSQTSLLASSRYFSIAILHTLPIGITRLLAFIPAYHISKLQVNILHAQAQQLTDTHSSSIQEAPAWHCP